MRGVQSGGQMSENTLTDAAIAKSGVPAAKKKAAGRSIKLKSSAWYQGAAQSIGITRGLLESRDELENQAATSVSRHKRT